MASWSLATWTGWAAATLVLVAVLLQLGHRVANGRRAALGTRTVSTHVAVGLSAAVVGFLHPLTAVVSLGSPEAVGGGTLALAFGALALLVMLAHGGLGLKLRDPTLRKRAAVRTRHVITAALLAAAIAAHVLACVYGGSD